jgi:hypothetical protein
MRSANGCRRVNTRWCRTSWSSTVKLKIVKPCTTARGIQMNGESTRTSAQVTSPRIRNWRMATTTWRAGDFVWNTRIWSREIARPSSARRPAACAL